MKTIIFLFIALMISACKVVSQAEYQASLNKTGTDYNRFKGLLGSWRMVSTDFSADKPTNMHFWVLKINAAGLCDWFEIYQAGCVARTKCVEQVTPEGNPQPLPPICQCSYTVLDNANAVIQIKFQGTPPIPEMNGTFNYSFYRPTLNDAKLGISTNDQFLVLSNSSSKRVRFIQFMGCPDYSFSTNVESNAFLFEGGSCANCD